MKLDSLAPSTKFNPETPIHVQNLKLCPCMFKSAFPSMQTMQGVSPVIGMHLCICVS